MDNNTVAAGIFFGIPYLIMCVLMVLSCLINTFLDLKHAIKTKDYDYIQLWLAITLLTAIVGWNIPIGGQQ